MSAIEKQRVRLTRYLRQHSDQSLGLLLLGALLLSLVLGIAQITPQLNCLPLPLSGTLALLLAWRWQRRLPARRAALRLAGIGLLWNSLSQTPIATALLAAGSAWLALLWSYLLSLGQWLSALRLNAGLPAAPTWPDSGTFRLLAGTALQRLLDLGQSGLYWFGGLLGDENATFDPLAAGLIWGLAVWGCAAWSAWLLRMASGDNQSEAGSAAHTPPGLLAALPTLLVLAAGLAYSRAPAGWLFPALALGFGLQTWAAYRRHSRRWARSGSDVADEITLELAFWSSGLIVGLLSLAFVLAGFSPQRAWQAQVEAARRLGESLGLLDAEPTPVPAAPQPVNPGILPRRHLLSAGPELSQREVMRVALDRDLGGALPNAPYWRGVTYDRYTGQGWYTSYLENAAYPAGEPISSSLSGPSLALTLQVQLSGAPLQVFSHGEPLSLDRAFIVDWRNGAADMFRMRPSRPPANAAYRLHSRLLWVGEAELRAAPLLPPPGSEQRYLAVPDNVPERVRRLAAVLGAGNPTPYDTARAIERYLRAYPYTLDLPAPPPDREISDYFLFDLRRGFCDYYATSMVVLARLNGLPARLAVGYASGRYDPAQQVYIVTEAEAHSWPEVYFSGLGWVRFEPTGARPETTLAAQAPPLPAAQALPAPPPAPPLRARLRAGWQAAAPWLVWIGKWLGLLLGGGLLLRLLLSTLDAWRLQRLGPQRAVAELYRRLRRSGATLGLAAPPDTTPLEYGAQLAAALSQAHLHPRLSRLPGTAHWQQALLRVLAPAPEAVWRIAGLYAGAIYSPRPASAAHAAEARHAWYRLRGRLLLVRWVVQPPQDRLKKTALPAPQQAP